MDGKKIEQIQGRIRGEGWFSIPQYNKSSSTCIPNISILAFILLEKSLTENVILQKYGRKENWTNTGNNKPEKIGS